MATAKMVMGALPGVDRPALATVLPTRREVPAFCWTSAPTSTASRKTSSSSRSWARLRAQRASDSQRRESAFFDRRRRSQGQRTHPRGLALLKLLPINFIGNVEGRDIYNGDADVIVCDGFVGNVALKTQKA